MLGKGSLGSPGQNSAPRSRPPPESALQPINHPLSICRLLRNALFYIITAGNGTQGGKLALDPVETTVSLLGSERDCEKSIKHRGSRFVW